YMPDKVVTKWQSVRSETSGLSRAHVARKPNLYTKYSLSYINELGRPVEETDAFYEPLNPEELYKAGYAVIYLFMVTSMDYFDAENGTGTYLEETNNISEQIEKIEEPGRTIFVQRLDNGTIEYIEETYKSGKHQGKTIRTTFNRNSSDRVDSYTREIVE